MYSTPNKVSGGSYSPRSPIISSSSNIDLTSPTSTPSTPIRTSSRTTYSCAQIETLLKKEKDRFVVIKNPNKKLTSACWQIFGFPAIIHSNGGSPERIDKFVSCRECYKTYSFTSNSTRFLLDHPCNPSTPTKRSNTLASMPSSPSVLQRSITVFTTPKKSKLNDITKSKIKELEARWICEDMRPFAVVDDPGFRRLAQELISIGKIILIRMKSMSFSILLGAQHGNVDVDEILRGAHTISSHINDLATNERSRIRSLLTGAIDNEKANDTAILTSRASTADEPPIKRKRFGEEFESSNLSDEFNDDGDDLDRYLSKHLEKKDITDNPLEFWKVVRSELPLLAKVARQICCVPATTASVERIFSHGGYIINERRTNLKPYQLNNVIFLRSLKSI
ncbi:unnamed protein product [Rotaria sp. Silwood2]|nr:unnamed protein product [Rotaria sp. Silwood2]